ncbi:MAG: metal-dependent hydrolase [Planctomycetaceae bacterium]|nr:MAG: metal-dependent hydrolase [Planctomycetaceae bacterium]
MTAVLTWLGHGTWLIETDDTKILLDPFLDDNPSSPVKAADVETDYILISHGHFDHIADAVSIAKRTGAQVITVFEIAQWLNQQGIENTLGMNIGGSVQLPFGKVTMTIAHHSSVLPDGTYGGNPAGFVLTIDRKRIYFACDTALFEDMVLIGSPRIDLAVLPIGDLFTMGPEESLRAIELLAPMMVAPAHYNTWPPIEQDVEEWALNVRHVTTAQPRVVPPGGKIYV